MNPGAIGRTNWLLSCRENSSSLSVPHAIFNWKLCGNGPTQRTHENVVCWEIPTTAQSVKPPRVESSEAQDKVVLCEDLVSAHKVANAGYLAMPLFGVNWHPCHVYYLMQEHKPIVLWLDKDQAGSIMRKAMGLQALTGCAVSSVSTDKDPKALTFSEINLCLT